MLYRDYGKTGKKISIISMGGMRYKEPQQKEEMAKIPVAAARLGINYFDTAPGYSENMSETILGLALKEMRRQNLPYYVSTKSGGMNYDQVKCDVESSLKKLGVDMLDFYNSWGINSREIYARRDRDGAFKAFEELKEQGVIKHMVCSSHMSGEELRWLAEQDRFEGFTFGFCAINFPFREEGIRAANEKGLGVIIMNPLGGGEIIEYPDRFDFIRTRDDQSLLEGALHFNQAHAGITSSLVGFRSLEDAQSAAATVDTYQPLGKAELTAIKNKIDNEFDELCTTCNYCRDCPEGIPVAKFIEAYNSWMLYKEKNRVFNRLKWHWNLMDLTELEKCTQCLQCEEACPQKLPIMERFEHLKELGKS